MNHAETPGLMPTKRDRTLQQILVAIGDSLSDLASSDDEEDGGNVDEDMEQRKLSQLDERC
jgi:hypothetical protein